jgi:hypothetical protein
LKSIFLYCLLALFLALAGGFPGGLASLNPVGAGSGHETDATDREETSENSSGTRSGRRPTRAHVDAVPVGRAIGNTLHRSHLSLQSFYFSGLHQPAHQSKIILRV